jgi:Tfp pilus assembly protein PilF
MKQASRAAIVVLLVAALSMAGCGGGKKKTTRSPLELYQMGRVMFEQGKVVESIDYLQKSLKEDDRNPQVHFYLAYVRWTQGEWIEAAAGFEKALEINPYYTEARIYLATCFNEMGDPARALQQLEQALLDRTHPGPEAIHLNIALIKKQSGELEGALASLREAVELNPKFYRAHLEMARILVELGRSDEAVAAFGVAEPGFGEDHEFHYEYGVALFRAGQPEEALRHLRKVVELAPGSQDAVEAKKLIAIIEAD